MGGTTSTGAGAPAGQTPQQQTQPFGFGGMGSSPSPFSQSQAPNFAQYLAPWANQPAPQTQTAQSSPVPSGPVAPPQQPQDWASLSPLIQYLQRAYPNFHINTQEIQPSAGLGQVANNPLSTALSSAQPSPQPSLGQSAAVQPLTSLSSSPGWPRPVSAQSLFPQGGLGGSGPMVRAMTSTPSVPSGSMGYSPVIPGFARGGRVGPLGGHTPGRADRLPMSVPSGAHVIPADVVSALGQGNTLAGHKVLGRIFPNSAHAGFAKGGSVPIKASDGEFIVSPHDVMEKGRGDPKHGHKVIDAFILSTRHDYANNLRRLPGPRG